MRKAVPFFTLFLLILLSTSCSKFRKIQKSGDPNEKLAAAMKYYEEEDYYRSTILFEEILPYFRGKEEAEEIQFYYAYAHFYQKQYVNSAHYFKNFYDVYNRSEYAEEAYYMYAYSLYMQSPPYNLDQTSTKEAITAMQTFLNKFPKSDKSEEATGIINELRLKLERKAFEKARNYYKLGIFKSAMVAYDNFEKDYPDSDFVEDIGFLKIKTMYDYAKNSVPSKQMERYKKCVTFYQSFIEDYPESDYISEAQDIYQDSLDEIEEQSKDNL